MFSGYDGGKQGFLPHFHFHLETPTSPSLLNLTSDSILVYSGVTMYIPYRELIENCKFHEFNIYNTILWALFYSISQAVISPKG